MKLKQLVLAVPVLLGLGILNFSYNMPPKRKLPIKTRFVDLSDVTFSEKVRDNIYSFYKEVGVEIPFCLYGSASRNRVHVEDMMAPHITKNEREKVSFKPETCKQLGRIGMAHNHPRDIGCLMSVDDVMRTAFDKRAKIELITCGANKEGSMDMNVYYIEDSR